MILRNHGHDTLPKDARTLLDTPREVFVEKKFGGDYIYLGMKKEIERRIAASSIESDIIKICINVDGLPLFKSSNISLWPILGLINECDKIPFPIALFCGSGKPNDCSGFLRDFIEEYNKLNTAGIIVNERQYHVKVVALICDAPARQYLKCIKGHNGYYGCERCEVKGVYIERRMIFEKIDEVKRETDIFLTRGYPEHQTGRSPNNILQEISKRLVSFKDNIPSEFARRPRSLDELCRWKATELRQFLLFTGIVALKGIVSANLYVHFLTLSIAMRIYLEPNKEYRNHLKEYAHNLLKFFVQNASSLYGNTFTTYNTRNLIHLLEDVEHYNECLEDVSAFPFENFMQTLKRNVKNANNPISQIVKRAHEIQTSNSLNQKQLISFITCRGRNSWFLLKSVKIQ